MAAAEALGQLGDARAVDPLLQSLSADGPSLQTAAATALGKLGDKRAVEPLMTFLCAMSDFKREAAAEALGQLGEPQWRQCIHGRSDDFERLAATHDPRLVNPLIKTLLEDSPNQTKQSIAKALGEWGDTRAVEPLIRHLTWGWSGNWPVFARALGKLGDVRAVEPLIKALRSNCGGNEGAAVALGELGDVRAVKPLIELLSDIEPNVRRRAAEALGKLGEPKWGELVRGDEKDFARLAVDQGQSDMLIKTLNNCHSDSLQRIYAIQGLTQLQCTDAVTHIIEALSASNSSVCVAAAEALGQSGDIRALDPLINALTLEGNGRHDYDPADIVEAAAKALGELGEPCAADPLVCTLGHPTPSVRIAAAKSLGRLGNAQWAGLVKGDDGDYARLGKSGDSRAVAPLVKALMWGGSCRAADALGILGDARAADALVQAIDRWPDDAEGIPDEGYIGLRPSEVICNAAIRALGELGDPRAIPHLRRWQTYHHRNPWFREESSRLLKKMRIT